MNKEEKAKIKYDNTHRTNSEGLIEKWCSYGEHWVIRNEDNFYKTKTGDEFHTYCKKCTSIKSWNWALKNYERYIDSQKRWEEKNKTEKNAVSRKWARDNSEKAKLYLADYQKTHPEKIKQYRLNREQNKTHTISKKEWESCQEYFNNSCAYCGLPKEEHYFTRKGVTKLGNFHKEHVNHTGENDLSNCVPACKSCNSSKKTKELEDWYNEKNAKFSKERYDKIHRWLEEDYKLYIKTFQ